MFPVEILEMMSRLCGVYVSLFLSLVWILLFVKHTFFYAFAVTDMCQRYPKATEVNVFGARAMHSLAIKAIESLR